MQTPPYEVIAGEYYDPKKHPTCAAFRQASLALYKRNLEFSDLSNSNVVEVGCGRSIFCDLPTNGWGQLRVVDQSPGMLEHSKACLPDGVEFIVGHAHDLDFPEDSVDLVISSLGDPFNHERFWQEASRVLRIGGFVLFSTPSVEWSSQYRSSADDPVHSALFALSNGDVVETPSYIVSRDDQRRLIENALLEVVSVDEFPLSHLDARITQHAPKLSALRDDDPVVSLYVCRK